MVAAPTLDEEISLFEQGVKFVAGVDEVGRGALAGPVSIGVAVVSTSTQSAPAGLRDSKQMSLVARENIIDAVKAWPVTYAVGSASAQEIDQIGIVNSLRLAKVERDSYMRELASSFPEYGWDSNVGYGASGHMDAIRKLGATQFHRKSWSLPAQVGV